MFDVLRRVICVAFCLCELRDMIHAARDEDGPFGFRAFCIVGDTLLMTLATKILWV